MIYLKGHEFVQSAYFPKSYKRGEGVLELHLHNTADLTDIVVEVTEEREMTDNYLLSFHLPKGIQVGEYTYTLTEDYRKVSEGIAVIEQSDEESKQYNTKIEYEQYNG